MDIITPICSGTRGMADRKDKIPIYNCGQFPDFVCDHDQLNNVRGSETTPDNAVAAAVNGEARNVRPPLP